MRVEIFDVGHGQCAVVTSPNGRRMMIDCGVRFRENGFWSPSLHFWGQRFEILALSNLDEDHISNFGYMLKHTTVGWILSNPTIQQLRLLKKDGMGLGAQAVADWMTTASNPLWSAVPLPDFGPTKIWWYYNRFIPGITNETNDLSLVIFVEYNGFKMIFSGDMEKAGWQQLLCNLHFRSHLMGTNIFVASHHGRESGQCAELFKWLRPEIILISDEAKKYESQETAQWYAERCTGAVVLADPRQRRYVVATRKDGSMQIDVSRDGRWVLRPTQVQDWPVAPAKPPRSTAGRGQLSNVKPSFESASIGLGLGVSNPFLQR